MHGLDSFIAWLASFLLPRGEKWAYEPGSGQSITGAFPFAYPADAMAPATTSLKDLSGRDLERGFWQYRNVS